MVSNKLSDRWFNLPNVSESSSSDGKKANNYNVDNDDNVSFSLSVGKGNYVDRNYILASEH